MKKMKVLAPFLSLAIALGLGSSISADEVNNSISAEIVGYTVDQNFNNLGKNEGTIKVTFDSSNNQAFLNASITFDDKEYSFNGTATPSNQYKEPVYTGFATIENSNTPIFFCF
ncbi:hypothetical protein AWM70_12790 [Paenibacillus yonginensis]|uniref:Uncharacterized protein n=1 Tax=Paenibacillus yonginensis TaxID=1462996 RepID=A0A1B1N1U1_9BACL|nr:hypothetical protein [Paenibacillus yonginensis]ANS75376.1 hypothetical protein AWM70_12790 [Paenibacillus yonginensis]